MIGDGRHPQQSCGLGPFDLSDEWVGWRSTRVFDRNEKWKSKSIKEWENLCIDSLEAVDDGLLELHDFLYGESMV